MNDRKRPKKGYRKAWNGGKPPEDTDATRAFHAHLDACQQCREHPFDLCSTGAVLLKAAATS